MSDFWEKYKDPRWQKKRLEVLNRAGFKCERCSDAASQLHIHHAYYKSGMKPWEYRDDTLFCLCEVCHSEVGEMCDDLRLAFCRLTAKQQDDLLTAAVMLCNSKKGVA